MSWFQICCNQKLRKLFEPIAFSHFLDDCQINVVYPDLYNSNILTRFDNGQNNVFVCVTIKFAESSVLSQRLELQKSPVSEHVVPTSTQGVFLSL